MGKGVKDRCHTDDGDDDVARGEEVPEEVVQGEKNVHKFSLAKPPTQQKPECALAEKRKRLMNYCLLPCNSLEIFKLWPQEDRSSGRQKVLSIGDFSLAGDGIYGRCQVAVWYFDFFSVHDFAPILSFCRGPASCWHPVSKSS